MPSSLEAYPRLASLLSNSVLDERGQPPEHTWPSLEISESSLLKLCEVEEIHGLLHQCLIDRNGGCDWPPALRDAISRKARAEAAVELVKAQQIRALLDDLAAANIQPILMKGTALAYSVYRSPSSRPRNDTDLLIAEADVARARDRMRALGFLESVHCSDLFSQFEAQKTDRLGVTHVFDVHWRISTQPIFAGLMTYEEVLRKAVPLPALGTSAAALGPVDALLLACLHPVMHHQNTERVLWIYDIHLLAARLSPGELREFVDQALLKKVSAICAHGLRIAQATFGAAIPAAIFEALASAAPEPSAEYLASQRRWRHEFVSSMRGSRSFGNRVRLLRQVLLPAPQYVLGSYGLSGKPLAPLLLPALYVHRNLRGVWKILVGKK